MSLKAFLVFCTKASSISAFQTSLFPATHPAFPGESQGVPRSDELYLGLVQGLLQWKLEASQEVIRCRATSAEFLLDVRAPRPVRLSLAALWSKLISAARTFDNRSAARNCMTLCDRVTVATQEDSSLPLLLLSRFPHNSDSPAPMVYVGYGIS
ncbi:hypothetical protein D9C73_027811 [Collichthys lucidus]|uniref:Uncharacterized protein n=1 Tax=Collichthys lucidus TaxID=240159 RepID=A0A4U5TYC6_COLLU|nr:hypothetical protein D9C73_027811 [Collichthys lucidus]